MLRRLSIFNMLSEVEHDLMSSVFSGLFSKPSSTFLSRYRKQSENENEYCWEITIPGFERENLKLLVKDNYLTVEGKIEKDNVTDSFSDCYSLPKNVDEEKITASCKAGICKIILPKKNKELEKKIQEIKIQ